MKNIAVRHRLPVKNTDKPSAPLCSAETAAELYRRLEYYRNFMPSCLDMTEADYAATQEAINADAALSAYREQTGTEAGIKPSE
jgi:hypothetical protein